MSSLTIKFQDEGDLKAIIWEHHMRWGYMTTYNPEDCEGDEPIQRFYPADHLEREAIQQALFRRIRFASSA